MKILRASFTDGSKRISLTEITSKVSVVPAWKVNTLRKYVIGESEHQMRLT